MTQRAPLPSGLDPEGFSVRAALTSGASAGRLRASDVSAPFRGTRRLGAAASVADLARTFSARMPSGGRFTHTTAAELHGLRMPEGWRESRLHVGVPAPARGPRVRGVVGHQVRPGAPVVELGGLPLSPAVAAWVECASILDTDDLVVMGDGLVKRWSPPARLDDLHRALDAAVGSRGRTRLAQALRWIRPGTDSARETLLRLILVRAGFPEPEVNGPIVNAHGAVIAHGDLVYRDQRVVVEYEGAGHLSEKQFAVDIRRLDGVMEERWRVIRVDKHLMAARAALLGKVATALSWQ